MEPGFSPGPRAGLEFSSVLLNFSRGAHIWTGVEAICHIHFLVHPGRQTEERSLEDFILENLLVPVVGEWEGHLSPPIQSYFADLSHCLHIL